MTDHVVFRTANQGFWWQTKDSGDGIFARAFWKQDENTMKLH